MWLEHLIRIPRNRSDNIRLIMVGPFVQALASVFQEIDYVRRDGGFDRPFRPEPKPNDQEAP